MIPTEPRVGPRRRAAEALVLHHGDMRQQRGLAAVVFEPLIRPQPDAVAIAVHFAPPIARAAARTVALVFRALGFGAEVSDFRQRAVAAVFAAEQQGLAHVFDEPEWLRPLHRIFRAGAKRGADATRRRIGREHRRVRPLRNAVNGSAISGAEYLSPWLLRPTSFVTVGWTGDGKNSLCYGRSRQWN